MTTRPPTKTTPDELLYTEITPVTNATIPVSESRVAVRASIPVKRSSPPVFSISPIRTVTPLTMMIGVHGSFLSACS